MDPERIVTDTNVLVSSLLRFQSSPGQAFARALNTAIVLVSDDTMAELADVLARPKLDPYVTARQRQDFLLELGGAAEWVTIIQLVRECRDPRDDKFLEVALNGRADLIITGDNDLIAMNPWREIAIVSPAEYLKR
jgi:putative PIN family toxin of toxin-antitoxin system